MAEEETWNQRELKRLHDELEKSAIFMALMTDAWKRDPTCLLQLGFAMMMEKPIVLVVPRGTRIPPALERIADAIEYFTGPEDMALAAKRAADRFTQG